MPLHVALLGSVNVGGNRIEMAKLRAAMEDAGFARVSTVVASGNVLFEATGADDALAGRIADLVERGFGFRPMVAVRTRDELAAAIAGNPFADEREDKAVHTMFLDGQPTPAQFAQLVADHAGRGAERLAPGDRALFIDFGGGVADSKLTGAFIERRLGCRGTARNVRSMRRILEKMG